MSSGSGPGGRGQGRGGSGSGGNRGSGRGSGGAASGGANTGRGRSATGDGRGRGNQGNTGGLNTGAGGFPGRGAGGGGRGGGTRGSGHEPRGRGRGDSNVRSRGGFSPRGRDGRLKESDLNALVSSFQRLQVTSNNPERPLRPGFGTRGTDILVRANFFSCKFPKDVVVHEYRVEISPRCRDEDKTRIFTLLEESPACRPFLKHIAHDGSEKLVSSKPLPQPLNVSITFREEEDQRPLDNAKVYNVSIVLSTEIDTNNLPGYLSGQNRDYNIAPLLSALNLVQQRYASQHGVRVGQSKWFFPLKESQPHLLGPGVIAVQGYYASVRPVYKELMVNVNACMSAFLNLPDNMVTALRQFNSNSRGAIPSLPQNLSRNLKVTTRYLGYKKRFKVQDIASTSARRTFFRHEDWGRISVEDYFKRAYSITLEHPDDVPVINAGKNKQVYIPAELCEIEPGQPYRGKLSNKETQQMIRFACNPPNVNAEAIVGDGFAKLGITPPSEALRSFSIEVGKEMAVVPARELPSPRLLYGQKAVSANNGAWNIVNSKFHRGARVESWWVMVVRDSSVGGTGSLVGGVQDRDLSSLLDNFSKKLISSGMKVPSTASCLFSTPALPPADKQKDPTRKAALEILRATFREQLQAASGNKPDFILVLLSYTDNFIYPGIKRICDVELGLNTIHLQLEKAMTEKRQDQYLSNVALKVNTKLGGVNHQLDNDAMNWLKKKRTMMVGIDVTHRGPGSKEGAPSIAAVVANNDDSFVQYPASLKIQQTHEIKEMVLELKDMMVERLQAYRTKTGKLPERVFVFRDGVSEGQYDIVLKEESLQILDAFKKFNTKEAKEPYRPLLSIVVCGKRHHARFYPTDAQNADPKTMNTRPGTVVDKGVTGVFDFDFYLQAHAGLQGTVKSTHYIVIYDENRFTADEIQQGINDSSYLYGRATRAVSLMPPAYYADQACERGRYYLHDFLTGEETEKKKDKTGSKGKAKEAEKQRIFEAAKKAWGEGVHPDLRSTMFYI
ncbi:argonaute-like protein [Moniliophthora roreri MCA 2997]|uniref:Argonaute-like protein n=1 Tax=Moniliophthora roreri (strain MCA 2997) TaxID=1381753 RepID=V2XL15_MONRO|nr:argonaute-like protein [Moniliophthora roreri MCA 2997]